MPRLVNNVSGIAANTDPVVNQAPILYNTDPLNVELSLLYTVYAWATTWDTAQIALYVSPQAEGSQIQPVWFPLVGADGVTPIVLSTANKYINFSVRFGAIKGEVINASANTVGLTCSLFNPGQNMLPSSP